MIPSGRQTIVARSIGAAVVLVAFVMLAGCAGQERTTAPDVVKVSGHIEGNESRLGVLVPGKVACVLVSEGDAVKKGQVLLRLDDRPVASLLKSADRLVSDAQESVKETEAILKGLKKQLSQVECYSTVQARQATEVVKSLSAGCSSRTSRAAGVGSGEPVLRACKDENFADVSLKAQEEGLDEMLSLQRRTIEQGNAAARSGLDEWYKTQSSAIKDARALHDHEGRMPWPFSIARHMKQAAAQEIIGTKQSALDEIYKTKTEALEQAIQVQERAVIESINARRKAMDEVAAAERTLSEQAGALTARSINAGQDRLDENFRTMQKSITRLSTLLSMPKGTPGGASASGALKLQTNEARLRLTALKAEVVRASAARDELLFKRSACTVTSPFNGVCTACKTAPGETVVPGQVLIKIIDPNAMCLKAYASEGDLVRVRIGQRGASIHGLATGETADGTGGGNGLSGVVYTGECVF